MANWPTFANSSFSHGSLPNVGGALVRYFRPLTFQKITKKTIGFQTVEETTEVTVQGVIQPLTDRQLQLLPEGQRAWTQDWLHAHPVPRLDVDDRVLIGDKRRRVMALKDYSEAGYIEYQLMQDYEGSDPIVVTP